MGLIKNYDAQHVYSVLQEHSDCKSLPIKTKFQIAKLVKKLKEILVIYQDAFNELLFNYGEKDEEGKIKSNGQGIIISPDVEEIAMKELKELNEYQNSLDDELFLDIETLEALDFSIDEIQELLPILKG